MRLHIWIDLDNTPHVPFFKPIVEELERRGHTVSLTVRDAFQVCELVRKVGLSHRVIGKYDGKGIFRKVLGLGRRMIQLVRELRGKAVHVGISHGSRAQLLACRLLGIPSLELTDYEHAQCGGLVKATWLMGPSALSGSSLSQRVSVFKSYSGIKEDVYVPSASLEENAQVRARFGITEDEIFTIVRPPATSAHYHDSRSESLLESIMNRALQTPSVRVVMLPRDNGQEQDLRSSHSSWFEDGRTIIPSDVEDGLSLIAAGDLLFSGGGTMGREAAALGIPAFSFFTGKLGAVDEMLVNEGRLRFVHSEEDLSKVEFVKKKSVSRDSGKSLPLEQIVGVIEELAVMGDSRYEG